MVFSGRNNSAARLNRCPILHGVEYYHMSGPFGELRSPRNRKDEFIISGPGQFCGLISKCRHGRKGIDTEER